MCGGLLAGWQVSPERGFRRSAAAASASKKPWPISSDTATTPERAKLEMWLTPENGSQGSSGTMLASPAMPASETAAPKLDVRRRSRNGSSRQSRMSSGTATIAAAASAGRRSGNMVNRNATVSASTTSTSRKLKVISIMSYLKRESTMMLTIITSDSAAAAAGRRSSMSQKKLRKAQVSSASVVANGPYSVRQTASSAAAWMAAMAATRSAGDAAMTFTPVKRRRERKSVIAMTRTSAPARSFSGAASSRRAPMLNLAWLLRPCRERPCRVRVAEQSDDLASPHRLPRPRGS